MEQNNIYQLVFKVTHAGGSGSCFYLKDYDLFVTNYHVVKGFHAVAVHDNDRNPYLAKVVLVLPEKCGQLAKVHFQNMIFPKKTLQVNLKMYKPKKLEPLWQVCRFQ